jgi:hypothetical protein
MLLLVSGYTTFASMPTFAWRPYVGRLLVAFIPAVAFFSAVASSQAIAVIHAFACCLLHHCCLHTCCCLLPFSLVNDVLTVAGLPAIVASLKLLAFLLLLLSLPVVDGVLAVASFLLLLASLLLLAYLLILASLFLAGVFTYCTVQCTLYNGTY